MKAKLSTTILANDCKQLAAAIGGNKLQLEKLLLIIEAKDGKRSDRAAWVLTFWMDEHSEKLQTLLPRFIKWLSDKNVSEPVKRQTLSIIQHMEIPETFHGKIMEICFDTIQSADIGSAPKAFCLHLLNRLCSIYPELLPEIRLIIEDRWPIEKAAFRSAASHLLKNHSNK